MNFPFKRRSPPASTEFKPETHPDHALVLAVTMPQRVPRWRQLRLINRVFTVNEMRVFYGALTVFFIALAAGIFGLCLPHLAQAPGKGGTVTEALVGSPKYLNPLFATLNDVDSDLCTLIFSGLFRLDADLNPVPDLAAAYQWLDDNKTLEIKLRDARFHDGQKVTSDDVVFTYQTAQDPTWRSPLIGQLKNLKVVRVDDVTVRFQLDKPDPELLANLTLGILPAHVWEDVTETSARLAEANQKPVGSGPFQIESFTRDAKGNILSYQLKRNTNYYGTAPYLDHWKFKFYPDRDQALTALKNNQVDALAFLPWSDADELKATGNRTLTMEQPLETVAFFNLKDPVLKDERVRRALNLAIDHDEVLQQIGNHAVAIYSPFPFMAAVSSTAVSSTADNLTAARALLDQSGWRLKTDETVRSWSGPPLSGTSRTRATSTVDTASSTALEITISVPNQPDLLKIAEVLRRRWSLIGAKVDIQFDEAENLLRTSVSDRTYQVLIWNILLPPSQDISEFWSGDKTEYNFSSLADRGVDADFALLKQATSTAALDQDRQTLSRDILSKTPALFLLRPAYAYLIASQIQGATDMRLARPSDRLVSALNWYVKTTWKWK